jgi:hypothetical protein
MKKEILPFFLFESLQEKDKMTPQQLSDLYKSLIQYCNSMGKDFREICKSISLEIPSWYEKLGIETISFLESKIQTGGSWSFNPETESIDIKGSFRMYYASSELDNLKKIKFGEVTENFKVTNCRLESLEEYGFPRKVGGIFSVEDNNLKNLKGGPDEIGGSMIVTNNPIKTLEGCPKKVGEFNISGINLLSGNLIGGPEEVEKSYNCNACGLTSLEGAPKKVGPNFSFYCSDNSLFTLEGLCLDPEVKFIYMEKNRFPLKPQVLKRAYKKAAECGSWIVGYLSMFTDPDFIKTGKSPKDPIREKLSKENIEREVRENFGPLSKGIKDIWKDFRVRKALKGVEIPEKIEKHLDLVSDMDELGF